MIVVADAGPLNYLVQIGAGELLRSLYGRVIIPESVVVELRHPHAPPVVRAWALAAPDWADVNPDPAPDGSLGDLDAGERAAIGIAVAVAADRLLIDDWAGRAEATRRGLQVTGTLGVLVEADLAGFGDFDALAQRLRRTNFRVSDAVVRRIAEMIGSERRR